MNTDSHAAPPHTDPPHTSDQQHDFVWPPPEADIDALVVIDLSTSAVLATVPGAREPEASSALSTASAQRAQPLRINLTDAAGRHQRPSRRLHLWAIGLGLVLVQWAEFGGYRPPHSGPHEAPHRAPPGVSTGQPNLAPTEHTAQRAAEPFGEPGGEPVGAAVGSRAALAASPELSRDGRRGDLSASTLPTSTLHRRARTTTRRARRAGLNDDRDGGQAEPAVYTAATRPLLPSTGDAGFVPPRALGYARPQLGPAPFPVPRGARTTLELVIDETGDVRSARVAASGAGVYDSTLVATARRWRFRPATLAGKPTRAVHIVHVPVSR